MASDGQIVFEVTADGKKAIANIKDITKAIEQEAGKWDDAAKGSTDNISSHFSGMLKKLAAGFSAVKIGKALLDLGKDALQAASDLQEVQNVVDTTFGAGANQIEKWAKDAGDQFGLTETQAKKFSSTMGAMLKSSGLAGDQIVDISTDLAGLAADMASFYNLDFEEAFSKIRSGMSGMTMPLKELGIDMSVDTMNAFALAQGLDKTFNQMTQGEQTILRYQYLMQATADAQGDFARTSDGYANTMRRLETSVDNLKAAFGKPFLDAVAGAVDALTGFLTSLAPDESKKTVLDDFLEIDQRTQAKLDEIASIKAEAEATAKVLDELFGNGEEGKGQNEQGTAAAEIISKYGVKSEEAAKHLQSLGFSTDEINIKQNTWLETCKRLVKTIPGLNSIINVETGEIKGGTKAVNDYITAWESGQKRLAMLGAVQQKENALNERFADIPGLELDMAVARRKARQSREKLEDLLKEYGLDGSFTADTIGTFVPGSAYATETLKLTNDQATALSNAVKEYKGFNNESVVAEANYRRQVEALEEAKAAIEEYRATIKELGEEEKTTLSKTEQFFLDNADAIRTLVDAAASAVQEMDTYAKSVRDSVEKAVDSTVKGFDKIETPAMKAKNKVQALDNQLKELKKNAQKNVKEIQKLEKDRAAITTGGDLVSAQGIGVNLKQQAQYMEDYLANLNKARSLGVSNELLAELSDGSEESYDILEALADAAPSEVEEINKNFQTVIDKKKQLTDELTGQRLTVDKTYENLAAKAKEAVEALDMEELAAEKTGNTMQGITSAITSHIPDVKEAVDGMLEQLNRLNGYGVNINLGGFGQITFTTSAGTTEGSERMGLDFVPHDDYIARLHQGERVLTAQENQIWNSLLNGGISGFDLESLGGVMRDNIKAGGNVYLDGKIVGNVISDYQGRSYKSMQRSGWQT